MGGTPTLDTTVGTPFRCPHCSRVSLTKVLDTRLAAVKDLLMAEMGSKE